MQSLLLVWSALWRLQVSHLLVFVLLPVAAAALRAALGIVLLPFLLVGFGSRTESSSELAYLKSPNCWLALAPCVLGDISLISPARQQSSASAVQPAATEAEPFIPAPSAFTVRHAWFVAWLLWFVAFLVHRARKKRAV